MAKPVVTVEVKGDTKPLRREIDKVSNKKVNINLDSKNFSAPLGKIKGELGEFDKSLAASNARVLAFGASAGAIYAIQRALSETVRATVEVEKALTEVNVILGASQKQLAGFGNELFNIAKKTGRSFQDVAIAGGELARQGLAMEETLKRTSDAMILARLSGLGVEESVNAITAALNGFRNAALNSTLVVDKMIAVDQAFAVSGADLAEALRRVGSTAEGAGVSLDELLGIVTAAQQITARGGAVIGNSFKTIFTRIQRPKVIEALDELGVKTKNAAGASLSATQVLKNLASTYDRLSEAQQAQIAELVGGVFQINVLKASLRDLGGEYSVFASATEIASRASGEAAKRNAELNKTLSAGLNEALQNLTKLATGVGKLTLEPAIRNVLKMVNLLTEKLTSGESEGAGQKIGQALLGGLGKFLSGPGLALAAAALFQLFNNLRKFAVDAFRTFSGLNASFRQQQQLQQGIVNILQQNPKILAQIQRGEISVDQAAKQILGSYKGMNAELVQMNAVASQLAQTMQRAGAGVKTVGGVKTIGNTKTKATGYVPNFADEGEVAAMAFSGMYNKSQMNNPRTRRGKVHDGRGGSFMASYNAHEKKRDVIGPNGRKGTIIASPAMQAAARGFIPNFASVRMKQKDAPESVIKAFNERKDKDQNWSAWSRKKGNVKDAMAVMATANLSGRAGIFTTGRSMSTRATMDLTTKDQLIKALGTTSPHLDNITGLKIGGLVQGSTKNIKDKLGKDSTFDNVVERELKKPLQNITKAMLGGGKDAKDIPSPIDTWKKASEDTSGYPQFLGRIFESAINSVLGVTPAKGGTWDYKGSDFNASGAQKTLYKSLFGDDLNKLKSAQNIDAKRSGYGQLATRDSIASKLGSTAAFRNDLNADVAAFLKARKASGYVPNFYKPLSDAIKRENNAGVSKGAIRVGRDRRMASGSNPFGLAVTNTRDEPRGIKDVLARGYVPNFVGGARAIAALVDAGEADFTPKGTKGGGDDGTTKVKTANEKNAKAKNKNTAVTNKSSGGMEKLFGITMLASLATSVFASATEGGSQEMQKIGASVNSVVTGASIMATVMMTVPGPIGLMLGATAGVTAGLLQYASSVNHASDKLLQNADFLEDSSANLSEQANSIQQTQQALQALKTALESGNAQEVQAAQKKYAETLSKLSPELRAKVMAEADTEGKQRVLGKAAAKTAKDKTETDAAKETNKLLQEQLKSQAKQEMLNSVFDKLKYIGGLVGTIVTMMALDSVMGAVGGGMRAVKAAKGTSVKGPTAFFKGLGKQGGIWKTISNVGRSLTVTLTKFGKSLSGAFKIIRAARIGSIFKSLRVAALAIKAPFAAVALAAAAIVQVIGGLGTLLKEPLKNVPILGTAARLASDHLDIFSGVLDFINAKKGEKEARESLKSKYKEAGKEEMGMTDKGREQMKSDATSLLNLIDPAKLTDEAMAKLRKAANRGGEEGLIKAMEELGVSAQKARPYIEGAASMTNGLALELTTQAKAAAASRAATARLQAVLDAQAAAAAAAARATEVANKRAMTLVSALNIMAKGIQNARKQARKNQREFMMETLKGGAGLAKQFQTSFASTKQEGDIKKLGINMKSAENAEKIREKGNKAVFDAIKGQKDVAKLFEKVGKNQGTAQENRLVQALQGTLQVATSGQGAAGAAQAVQLALARAQGRGGALEGQKVEIPGLLDILSEQSIAMGKAEQTRLHQLRLSELQTQLAQEQNKIDMQMASGGGIKTFLDQSGKQMNGMEEGFNKAVEDFKTASARGDTVKSGQAAGNLLSNLNEFMGTSLMNVPGLKDITEKGLEQSLRGRAFARADVLDQAAADTGNMELAAAADALRNMDFAATAATQVAAEFKRQKMPANIESMLAVQQQLQQLQQNDLVANRQTAVNTRDMADFLTGGAFSAGVANMVARLPAPVVQGLGGVQTAMNQAAAAMQGVANAINQAEATKVKADKLKEMSGKRAKLEMELEDMVKTMGADGITGREAQAIQAKMREIGALTGNMATVAQGMSAEARAALGPEFTDELDDRAASATKLRRQGFGNLSDTHLDRLGPIIAHAIREMRDPRQQMTMRDRGDDILNTQEAQDALDTFKTLNIRDNLQQMALNQGKDVAIANARQMMQNLQARIHSPGGGGINRDEAALRMAMLEEMIERIQTGTTDKSQTDKEFIEEVMRNIKNEVNNTINITIPAGMSVTGKEEIYTIKNRLDALENGQPANNTGAPVNTPAPANR